MNNKLKNYTDFIENHLSNKKIKYVIEEGFPSKEDKALGLFGYYIMIVTQDATGIMSDSTDEGKMLYALSFHKVDEYVREYVSEEALNDVESFIMIKDLVSFVSVLSSKKAIDRFVKVLKSQLKEDLNL